MLYYNNQATDGRERRIPEWLWDNMRDIHAPRYESTVDACVGPMLHVIFPEEGSFKVAPHHKVRHEVASKPREGQSLIARRTGDWAAGTRPEDGSGNDPPGRRSWVESEETLRDRLMQQDDTDSIDFNPQAQSTPRVLVGAATSRKDDSPSSLDFTFLSEHIEEQIESPIDLASIEELSTPFFSTNAPSSSQAEQYRSPHNQEGKNVSYASGDAGPSTPYTGVQADEQWLEPPPEWEVAQSSLMLSSSDFDRAMDSVNPITPQVSGFPSDREDSDAVSLDTFRREVPARGHGHAPHGIPDFMVLRQDTYDVLLIVEDKLHDNPLHQLSLYSYLFPESLDIWFMGCRVAKEPEGGLEFMLAERDRTNMGGILVEYEAIPNKAWYRWDSAHIHNKLREIARLNWKAADIRDRDLTD